MQKTVKLALSKFPAVPASLEDPANPGNARSEILVELSDLYHHYYLQSFDAAPPDPDPAHFEHVRLLEPTTPFRFQPNGLGANKTKRQNNSNELGEAFCRWFLDKHLEISHVARIEDVRDHGALAFAHGVSVETDTTVEGDAPDYFCVNASGDVFLSEAKGTITPVGFKTAKFATWRKQFDRVRVLDPSGTPMSVKGYIVAMRWAIHTHSENIFTKLSAEDPQTPGERRFVDEGGVLGSAIRSLHYATSLSKLRQPVLASALRTGTRISPELSFQVVLWESFLPSLKGLRFVGGYYPSDRGGGLPYYLDDGKLVFHPKDPFRLDLASGTFFGIEEQVFRQLVNTARQGPELLRELRRLERRVTGYSGVSYLPDGHILGQVELFYPVATDAV